MATTSLAYGTFILSVASLYNRVIGFVYQVLIVRMIHAEGIGLYSMVYPIYVMVLVLASAGIPVAIAKLVAEEMARRNPGKAYQLFRTSLGFIVVFAVICTLALVVGTPWLLRHIFVNPAVAPAFNALIPGVFIVSVCSAFRGFFQGLQQMGPTAVTQALEQTVRVGVGLALAWVLLPRGVAYATAGASAGVVVGELFGFIAMLTIFFRRRASFASVESKGSSRFFNDSQRIFSFAVPVTIARFASTALMSVDATLIPQRLAVSGMTLLEATATYGKLVGMAETLLYTPGILTVSLATALVPAVSDANAHQDRNALSRRVSDALRLTMIIGIPAAVVYVLIPMPICDLLFGYPDAGAILALLGIGGPFLYLVQTTTGILQGLGRVMEPLRNLIIASLIKVVGIYYCTALWGIAGTSIVLTLHFILMAVLNLRDVLVCTQCRLDWHRLVTRPLVAGAVMVLAVKAAMCCQGMSAWGIVLVLVSGLAVYLFTLVLIGGMTRSELDRLCIMAVLFKRAVRQRF